MKFSRGVEAFLAVLRNKASCGDRKASVEELEPRRLLSVSAAVSGSATVNEGAIYTLTLSGSASAPTPTKDHWTIYWGEGSPQTISGAATTVTHVYGDNATPQIPIPSMSTSKLAASTMR